MSWKFEVELKVSVNENKTGFLHQSGGKKTKENIKAVVNLLQASIIVRDIDMVKFITKALFKHFPEDGGSMFTETLIFPEDQEVIENLTLNCIWIREACAIHLATFWHCESLSHLIKTKPELGNQGTCDLNIGPIHIAAALDNILIIRLLIHFKVDVEG